MKSSHHHPRFETAFVIQPLKVSVTIPESGGLGIAKSLRILRLLRVYRSIKGVKALGGRDWTGHSKANRTVAVVAVPVALTILQVCGSSCKAAWIHFWQWPLGGTFYISSMASMLFALCFTQIIMRHNKLHYVLISHCSVFAYKLYDMPNL